MKKLKRLWYKVWFNKKDGMLLGINPRGTCQNCPHYQKAASMPGLGIPPATPQPNTISIIASDLDQPLLDIINKPPDVVLAHAELQIWEPEPH